MEKTLAAGLANEKRTQPQAAAVRPDVKRTPYQDEQHGICVRPEGRAMPQCCGPRLKYSPCLQVLVHIALRMSFAIARTFKTKAHCFMHYIIPSLKPYKYQFAFYAPPSTPAIQSRINILQYGACSSGKIHCHRPTILGFERTWYKHFDWGNLRLLWCICGTFSSNARVLSIDAAF